MKEILNVKGMMCNHCSQMVKAEVLDIEGVKDVKASYETGVVEIEHENADVNKMKEAIKSLGYEVE